MKLSMLSIVDRTARARELIVNDLAAVDLGLIRINLGGREQDDAMAAAAKAAILAELKGRKASLERDLESYGVDVGAD